MLLKTRTKPIDLEEHKRWVDLQQELAVGGVQTNAAVLQTLAKLYRKEEHIDTLQDFHSKKEATVTTTKKDVELSIWRLRLTRAQQSTKKLRRDDDQDMNLMTRYVKGKYEAEPPEEKKGIGRLADNIQDVLMKLTSNFNDQINDAMHSDNTNPNISVQENNPLAALMQLHAIEQNMKAIDHDMAILEKNLTEQHGDIGDLLVGFGCADDTYTESQGFYSRSCSSSYDDDDDESTQDDSDDEEDNDDDDDESSQEESDDDSDDDDDDDDDDNDDLMKEMAKEMGIIVPEGMNLDELLADSDSEYSSDDDDDDDDRSEEHTSELQSPFHISYAVFCL